MPFISVKAIGEPLAQHQVKAIQEGITALMVDVLRKVGPLVAVLVEQVPAKSWTVGGEPVACAAQVDAIVSAGTNTAEEKARFVREANALLKSVIGSRLSEVSYVVIHEAPKDSWGYDGLTQAYRADAHASREA
ncbi:tautomerase family protein [Caballeronia sp. AZ10_KS36]|uniref:tautomerase family protein n=1 Tax=Caballeronia sp. AZ10_KS36 TaxID=2921757 RepID=UPI0020291578|nr:tautomerase family protein [Caballeronia sp. AZ10_KS36]